MTGLPPNPSPAEPAGTPPPAQRIRVRVLLGGAGAALLLLLPCWFYVAGQLAPRKAYDKIRVGMTENEVRESLGSPTNKLHAHPRTGANGYYFLYQVGGGKELLVRFQTVMEPGKSVFNNVVVEKECGDWHEGEPPGRER